MKPQLFPFSTDYVIEYTDKLVWGSSDELVQYIFYGKWKLDGFWFGMPFERISKVKWEIK